METDRTYSTLAQELVAGDDDDDDGDDGRDEGPDEAMSRQMKQCREILHAVLRGLSVQFDPGQRAPAATCASCCWSAVSDAQSSSMRSKSVLNCIVLLTEA